METLSKLFWFTVIGTCIGALFGVPGAGCLFGFLLAAGLYVPEHGGRWP